MKIKEIYLDDYNLGIAYTSIQFRLRKRYIVKKGQVCRINYPDGHQQLTVISDKHRSPYYAYACTHNSCVFARGLKSGFLGGTSPEYHQCILGNPVCHRGNHAFRPIEDVLEEL